MTESFTLRAPSADEHAAIATLLTAAFQGPDEARLVDLLRRSGAMLLERVAVDGAALLGHIAFSRVTVTDGDDTVRIAALAPLAVRPDLQRRGIGSALVRDGLKELRTRGEDLAVVVGDTAYYPRFGFSTELARQVSCSWSGPAFMAMALAPDADRHLPVSVAFAEPFALFE
ncbi:N-acetyltransferase [Breoghania sp. L-A4]|uniref:GNAT family N-acetyltransferase n=1 Tax=Breoghania sp. L-A4 TaxID=2304600 RepID=UPI000E35F247|nr:N-acetyltransferase [Breoghania sp. L-A4]AXS39121.1 N-acetyltransferase [Breoghania sp. L-A4]